MTRAHLSLSAALLALTACVNADSVDGPVDVPLTVIATYEGNLPTAEFTLWSAPASEPQRIVTDRAIDTDADAGTRMIVRYVPRPGGQATLTGIGAVTNLEAQSMEGFPSAWDADAVWVESVSGSGPYVDFRLRLPYSQEPRMFALAVDSRTLGDDTIHAVLAHRLPQGVSPEQTFSRRYYASANLESLWAASTANALAITINNANLTNHKTFIIPSWNRKKTK